MGLSEAAEYSMLDSAITSVQEVYLLGNCFYTLQDMHIYTVVCRACCVARRVLRVVCSGVAWHV